MTNDTILTFGLTWIHDGAVSSVSHVIFVSVLLAILRSLNTVVVLVGLRYLIIVLRGLLMGGGWGVTGADQAGT